MTVKNGEHQHVVPDVDSHALQVRSTYTPRDLPEIVLVISTGHVKEDGRECVAITERDQFADELTAFATVETDPTDDVERDKVILHFERGLQRNPGLLHGAIEGTLVKLHEEGMLPSGLASREIDLTLEASDPRLDAELHVAAEGLSLWGQVHVEDHVIAPSISQTPESHTPIAA